MTRAQVDEFNASLDELQRQAEGYQRSLLRAYMEDNPSASVAEVREFCIAAIDDALGIYAGPASELAAAMFEWVCEGEGIDASASIPDEPIDRKAMVEKVHYEAGRLKDGDREGFAKQTGALTAFYVRRCAFETTALSCRDADVRFARVPTGRETCGWCFMLSSRGWDYKSEQTAAAGSHRGCDCVMVPGVDGQTVVEGYDPGELYARYKKCSDAVDVESFKRRTDAEWDAMGEEARAKWRTATTGAVLTDEERERLGITGDASAKSRFTQHRWTSAITSEIETRDWDWLWTGRVPAIRKEKGAKPEPHEQEAARLLAAAGFSVDFKKPKGDQSGGFEKRTPDTELGTVKWEMKNPEGDNDKTVKNQLKSAVGKNGKQLQCSRVVISNVRSSITLEKMLKDLHGIFAEGRFSEIEEVILLDKGGGLVRVPNENSR